MYFPPSPDVGDDFWNETGQYCIYTPLGWECDGQLVIPDGLVNCDVIQLTAVSGQTIFPLGQVLENPLCSTLYINGQQQRLGFHYSFNNVFDTLIWSNVNFILEPNDLIDLKIKQ